MEKTDRLHKKFLITKYCIGPGGLHISDTVPVEGLVYIRVRQHVSIRRRVSRRNKTVAITGDKLSSWLI